jgi:hypothetical protein
VYCHLDQVEQLQCCRLLPPAQQARGWLLAVLSCPMRAGCWLSCPVLSDEATGWAATECSLGAVWCSLAAAMWALRYSQQQIWRTANCMTIGKLCGAIQLAYFSLHYLAACLPSLRVCVCANQLDGRCSCRLQRYLDCLACFAGRR